MTGRAFLLLGLAIALSIAFPCGPKFDFPGPVGYLEVYNLLPPGAPRTVSMWMWAIPTNGATLYGTGPSTCGDQREFHWGFDLPGGFFTGSCNVVSLPLGASVPGLQWAHVALTYTEPWLALYVNGTRQANVSQAAYNLAMTTSDITWFGRRTFNDTGTQYYGYMSDIRVYNRQLSDSEVALDMTSNPPLPGCLVQIDTGCNETDFVDAVGNFSIVSVGVRTSASDFPGCVSPAPAPSPLPAPSPAPSPLPAPSPDPSPSPAPSPAPSPLPASSPAPSPLPAPAPSSFAPSLSPLPAPLSPSPAPPAASPSPLPPPPTTVEEGPIPCPIGNECPEGMACFEKFTGNICVPADAGRLYVF